MFKELFLFCSAIAMLCASCVTLNRNQGEQSANGTATEEFSNKNNVCGKLEQKELDADGNGNALKETASENNGNSAEVKGQASRHSHRSDRKEATVDGRKWMGTKEMPSHKASSKDMAILQLIRSLIRPPKTIYGRIIDQNGEPVAGAVLRLYYSAFSLNSWMFVNDKMLTAVSDKNGNWKCRIPVHVEWKGRPYIEDIKLYGIEWDRVADPDWELKYNEEKWARMWAENSRRNRHVNVVRKKVDMTYIIIGRCEHCNSRFGLHDKRTDVYLNLANHARCYEPDPKKLLYLSDTEKIDECIPAYDLSFHARRLVEEDGWELVIRPYGTESGIIQWKGEKLYSAPEEGYHDEFRIRLKNGAEQDLVLYAKTRSFPLYSEISLKLYASNPKENDGDAVKEKEHPDHWVNIQVTGYKMNPFGKHGLEYDEGYDTGFYYDILDMLEKQLKTNHLPSEEEMKPFRIIPDYTKDEPFAVSDSLKEEFRQRLNILKTKR